MPVRLLSRRYTVGAALALPLVVSACDIDPPARGNASGEVVSAPPEDSALVASVVAAVVDAAGTVSAASEVTPDLATRLTGLARAHAAHLELLVGAVPDAEVPTAGPATIPPRPAQALVAVRRSEQRLLRTLRESCAAAASGDLARVLASMAGSISQHVATLSPEGGR